MFTLFAIISGVLNTVTVMQNGDLTGFYGAYSGTVLVHLVGLVTVLVIYAFMRKGLPVRQKTPAWIYMGGVIGVGTVVFMTGAYRYIDVTALTALGLLGQTLCSIVVDQFGLFGSEKHSFSVGRCWAVLAVAAGAAVMIFPMDDTALVGVLMALGSGVTIVCARVLNGRLALRQGAMRSTVMNYVTGLLTAAVFMLLLGRGEPLWTAPAISSNWFMYLGGAFGVGMIMLLNVTVPRISSFAFTLLAFVGQISSSLLLDTLLQGVFSTRNLLGGILVAVGLTLDAWLTKKQAHEHAA